MSSTNTNTAAQKRDLEPAALNTLALSEPSLTTAKYAQLCIRDLPGGNNPIVDLRDVSYIEQPDNNLLLLNFKSGAHLRLELNNLPRYATILTNYWRTLKHVEHKFK